MEGEILLKTLKIIREEQEKEASGGAELGENLIRNGLGFSEITLFLT